MKIEYIVIHHSGIKNSDGDSYLLWESIKKNHQAKYKSRYPWYISDYHFSITKDLRIFNGNPITLPCFHSGDDFINFRSLSICFFGNFDLEILDRKQFEIGVLKITEVAKEFSISTKRILKHSDIVPTSCPGKNFPFEELKEKVESNLKINWKEEAIEFVKKKNWVKNDHKPTEIVDFGTLAQILKNFYEVEFKKGGEK
ncbi:MAG: peptidoglycan recognition protein family protein [Caldisericia bacterium]|nr:peptidoglycan recognition protein family protein [Caldisericia bacterium]